MSSYRLTKVMPEYCSQTCLTFEWLLYIFLVSVIVLQCLLSLQCTRSISLCKGSLQNPEIFRITSVIFRYMTAFEELGVIPELGEAVNSLGWE